jgi:hypothetical protein
MVSRQSGALRLETVANALGTLLYVSQNCFGECTVKIFVFIQSPYTALRPRCLGRNLPENILKDYNGQTYWFIQFAFLLKDIKNTNGSI